MSNHDSVWTVVEPRTNKQIGVWAVISHYASLGLYSDKMKREKRKTVQTESWLLICLDPELRLDCNLQHIDITRIVENKGKFSTNNLLHLSDLIMIEGKYYTY